MRSLSNSSYYAKEIERVEKIKSRVDNWKKKIMETSKNKAYIDQLSKKLSNWIEKARKNRDISRTWIHVDMDMFYAAVVLLDNPTLNLKQILYYKYRSSDFL